MILVDFFITRTTFNDDMCSCFSIGAINASTIRDLRAYQKKGNALILEEVDLGIHFFVDCNQKSG